MTLTTQFHRPTVFCSSHETWQIPARMSTVPLALQLRLTRFDGTVNTHERLIMKGAVRIWQALFTGLGCHPLNQKPEQGVLCQGGSCS